MFVSGMGEQVCTSFYQVVFLQNKATLLRLAVRIEVNSLLSLFYFLGAQLTRVILPDDFIYVLPMAY